MSHTLDEKEPAFKVVDKRRFTEEGDERNVLESADVQAPEHGKFAEHADLGQHDMPAMNFSLFIQSLVHQAMLGLGLEAWPDSELIQQDLDLARHTIDILRIMQEKTAGNLNADEKTLLDGMVYQLQVAYVEIAKNSAGSK